MTEVKLDFDKQGGLGTSQRDRLQDGAGAHVGLYANEESHQLTLETKQMHIGAVLEMSFGIISNMSKVSRQIVIRTPCLSLWKAACHTGATAVSTDIYDDNQDKGSSYVRNTFIRKP